MKQSHGEAVAPTGDRGRGGLLDALEKTRLFESILESITALAETRPVVVVIEDLHWADSASAELLTFLVRLGVHGRGLANRPRDRRHSGCSNRSNSWHGAARIPLIQADAGSHRSSTVGEELNLTPREVEVLAHIASGHTDREIADVLFISKKTASVHVSNLLRKLDVANRVEEGRIGQAHL